MIRKCWKLKPAHIPASWEIWVESLHFPNIWWQKQLAACGDPNPVIKGECNQVLFFWSGGDGYIF